MLVEIIYWSYVINLSNVLDRREKMFIFILMVFVVWIKLIVYKLCFFILVLMVRILGLKMMLFGLKFSFFISRW